MQEENRERKKEFICKIARMMYEKNLVSGKDGNISIRTGKDEMIITPSGVSKAFLEPEMLIVQKFDGRIVEGTYKSTKEAALHSCLYEGKPEIGAIVHTHPAAATAFAVCGIPLFDNCLLEVPALLGKIGLAGYAPAGSKELIHEVKKVLDSDVIFLQNHGVITYGTDLQDAFSRMDAVENAAKTLIYAKILGRIKEF